jgi:hypothetical protein
MPSGVGYMPSGDEYISSGVGDMPYFIGYMWFLKC